MIRSAGALSFAVAVSLTALAFPSGPKGTEWESEQELGLNKLPPGRCSHLSHPSSLIPHPSSLDLIFGACGDKDVGEVLSILSPIVKKGFAVKTNNPRSLSAEETAARMRTAGIDAIPCASICEAIDRASGVSNLKHSNTQTLICGSLFLAGEALVALDAYPWGAPRFDKSELFVN